MWAAYLEENGIELVRIGEEADRQLALGSLSATKSSQPMSEELVLRALHVVSPSVLGVWCQLVVSGRGDDAGEGAWKRLAPLSTRHTCTGRGRLQVSSHGRGSPWEAPVGRPPRLPAEAPTLEPHFGV